MVLLSFSFRTRRVIHVYIRTVSRLELISRCCFNRNGATGTCFRVFQADLLTRVLLYQGIHKDLRMEQCLLIPMHVA